VFSISWIIKYYKIAGKIPFIKEVGAKFKSKRLIEAIRFYNYYNELDKFITIYDVGAASIFTFILSFIIINLVLFQYNYLMSFMISLILSLVISRKLYYYIINEFEFQYLNSLQFLDLMYQDFLIIKNSTQSIFDAIEFVANSNYPVVSKNFKDIVFNINNGESPETLLLNYSRYLPNYTFKERIFNLIGYDMKLKSETQNEHDFSVELSSKYQEYTKQLDTRITILITINIFLPILTTIMFSFYFSINNYLIFLLIPFHVFLLLILRNVLLKKEFFILGAEPNKHSEFDEIILILTLFANNLMINNSPEIALIHAINTYNGPLKDNLEIISKKLLFEYNSIDDIWSIFYKSINDAQSKILLKLTSKMLKKNSKETGSRLRNIINNINKNKSIIKNRYLIIKSQQFKVLILIFVLSGLMGIMTNIIPIFGEFFKFISIGEPITFNLSIFDLHLLIPVLITFSSILFITTIVITKAVKFKRSYFLGFVVSILYFLIVYLINTLLF